MRDLLARRGGPSWPQEVSARHVLALGEQGVRVLRRPDGRERLRLSGVTGAALVEDGKGELAGLLTWASTSTTSISRRRAG